MHVSYGDWLASNVKWALRNADAIIAVSPFSAKSIVDAGFAAGKVHTVLNSLDLASQRWNSRSTAREVRASLGIPEGAVVMGVVSRLFLYKGHRALLDALARDGVRRHGGKLYGAATRPRLPPHIQRAVDAIRRDLAEAPFRAPEAGRLAELGLTPRLLSAAAAAPSAAVSAGSAACPIVVCGELEPWRAVWFCTT